MDAHVCRDVLTGALIAAAEPSAYFSHRLRLSIIKPPREISARRRKAKVPAWNHHAGTVKRCRNRIEPDPSAAYFDFSVAVAVCVTVGVPPVAVTVNG